MFLRAKVKEIRQAHENKSKKLLRIKLPMPILGRQHGKQPWSEEKQRAFNKMALLQQAVEEARTLEEVEETKRLLSGKVIWERK